MQVNSKLVSTNKNIESWLIVDINYQDQLIAVSDLTCKSPKRPKKFTFEYLNQRLATGELKLEEHDFSAVILAEEESIPEYWRRLRDESYWAISPLIEDHHMLHRYLYSDSAGILKLLCARAEKEYQPCVLEQHKKGINSKKGKKFIQSAINRYFINGGCINSLLPEFEVCGNQYLGPEAPVVLPNGNVCLKSKPGVSTKYGDPHRHITRLDKTNIKAFSKKIKRGQKVNLTALYLDYCREHYVMRIRPKGVSDDDVAEEFYAVLPVKHRISPRAFKRYLKQCVGSLQWIKMRVGNTNYDRDHKGKPGTSKNGLRGPGSRYEIDSTVADCYIRYEFTTDELLSIGRPIIYLVIDVVSTRIVGLHACFHGPDWHGASQALFNAFTDKEEFCKRHGVKYRKEEWDEGIVSREVTFDRGCENTHKHLRPLLKLTCGITAANFNAYHRGDAKGVVEQKFNTVQNAVIPESAGKVYKIPRLEDQHPSRTPVYTYQQFMHRLIKHIIHINNHTERVDSHNFEMEKEGVGYTPREVWDWGMKEAIIKPPKKSRETLRFALLPEEKAVVRDKGIYFRGLYYSSNEVIALEWLDLAKNDGRFSIDVRYSDISTTYIWCRHPDTKKVMQLEVTDRSERYKNQLWTQVIARHEFVKDKLARQRGKALEARVLLDQDLAEMDKIYADEIKHFKQSTAKGIQQDIKDRKDEVGAVQKHEDHQSILDDLNDAKDHELTAKPESQVDFDDLKAPTSVPYLPQENTNE